MPTPSAKPQAGPVFFSYGFRPFFLLGSLFSAAAIVLWLPLYLGEFAMPTAFAPRDWHVHEMLFGFVPAIVAGFLLTAIPNWTGRAPLRGGVLMLLVSVWVGGRLACAISAYTGWAVAMAVDLAFLVMLAAFAGREIIASKNLRNLRVLAAVGVLLLANGLFHVEAQRGGGDYGVRLGLSAIILLVGLVGGRIIPAFTRNVLVRQNATRLPVQFARFDAITMIATALALASWTIAPDWIGSAAALCLAAVLNAARLARWAGAQTWRDPLLLVLHVAFAFLPLGLFLLGFGSAGLVEPSAGVHVLTIGCIGLITLAVMSRASLGHTGRALRASPAVQLIYILVLGAVGARIGAIVSPRAALVFLHLAAGCWALAFGGFAVAYWKVFTGPKVH